MHRAICPATTASRDPSLGSRPGGSVLEAAPAPPAGALLNTLHHSVRAQRPRVRVTSRGAPSAPAGPRGVEFGPPSPHRRGARGPGGGGVRGAATPPLDQHPVRVASQATLRAARSQAHRLTASPAGEGVPQGASVPSRRGAGPVRGPGLKITAPSASKSGGDGVQCARKGGPSGAASCPRTRS